MLYCLQVAFDRNQQNTPNFQILFQFSLTSPNIQESEILPQMTARCTAMMEIKDNQFAAAKRDATNTVISTMRAVAAMQTDIQFKLKKGGNKQVLTTFDELLPFSASQLFRSACEFM
jgi:hypothetical protein